MASKEHSAYTDYEQNHLKCTVISLNQEADSKVLDLCMSIIENFNQPIVMLELAETNDEEP